jgi:hypothetical protein
MELDLAFGRILLEVRGDIAELQGHGVLLLLVMLR